MEELNIWYLVWLGLVLVIASSAFYDDKRYKPFGFRYWLSVVGAFWLVLVALFSCLIFVTSISLMLYHRFVNGTVLLGILFFLMTLALVSYVYFACKRVVARTRFYRSMTRRD